jgi:hypothetical protein
MAGGRRVRDEGSPTLHSVLVHTLAHLDLGGAQDVDRIITELWANGVKLSWLKSKT